MCHIFLVLHFQIGQPSMGTNLVFYSIMFVCLASQILPVAGTIIFLRAADLHYLLVRTNVRLG